VLSVLPGQFLLKDLVLETGTDDLLALITRERS